MTLLKFVAIAGLFLSGFLTNVNAQKSINNNQPLDKKEQTLVLMVALTGKGDMPRLLPACNEALDAGWTINELKEAMVQVYAYAGFPRSLNGLSTLRTAAEERKKKGIIDSMGTEPAPLPTDKSRLEAGTALQAKLLGSNMKTSVADFAPIIDSFLKEHLFWDIFGRNNLNFRTRELITISTLAGLGNADAQLKAHMGVSIYNGVTEPQLQQFVSIIQSGVGVKEGVSAKAALQEVLKRRQAQQPGTNGSSGKDGVSQSAEEQAAGTDGLQLKITVGKTVLYAPFVDSKTTADFIKKLPLTLSMGEIGNREKYSSIDGELSKEGAVKKTYAIGDIAYWLGGGIAVFYNKDERQIQAGLITLAHLGKGIENFRVPGSVQVSFEAVKK